MHERFVKRVACLTGYYKDEMPLERLTRTNLITVIEMGGVACYTAMKFYYETAALV